MYIYPGSLTKDFVTIIFENGQKKNFARAYKNCDCPRNTGGRADLESDCTEEIVNAVYAVWGDTPTIEAPKSEIVSEPQPTDEQKQQAAILLTQAQQQTAIKELQQANAALLLKIAGGD